MKQIKTVLLMALFASMAFGAVTLTTGCKEKDPMDKATDAVEDAAEEAGDAAKDAGDAIEDATD